MRRSGTLRRRGEANEQLGTRVSRAAWVLLVYSPLASSGYRPVYSTIRPVEKKVQALERKIATIKRHLALLGDLRPGSLSEQYNVCGSPGCKCKADPPV